MTAVELTADEVAAAQPRPWALSPSRAGDFMTCPQLYRFRVIDRLPEPSSPVTTRGTLVHGVLERLFDSPAFERTIERAASLLEPEWERLLEERPELLDLFRDGEAGPSADAISAWLASARVLLETYFALEDPTRIEPAEREVLVEATLDGGVRLRGFVDRVDVGSGGQVRIVDYKTGRSPSEFFEAKALFQLKFYALVMWRVSGAIPAQLQLLYLGDGQVLRYAPDEADLLGTERKVRALWAAIERALETRHFPPRRGPLCDWCAHQSICPEFGGVPPAYPEPADAALALPVDQPAEADDITP
ncbi:MAG TPA: PD-(D/E)XK nuclease family protein [Acidothermaceae bacterium]|jgi:putative RecB family exonuclease|nr:PD-(D/E)XK nuclease family protein [Acidothermaceae bacterium]